MNPKTLQPENQDWIWEKLSCQTRIYRIYHPRTKTRNPPVIDICVCVFSYLWTLTISNLISMTLDWSQIPHEVLGHLKNDLNLHIMIIYHRWNQITSRLYAISWFRELKTGWPAKICLRTLSVGHYRSWHCSHFFKLQSTATWYNSLQINIELIADS